MRRVHDFGYLVRRLKVMKLQCFVDKLAAIFFGELIHYMWCRLANE